MHFLNYVDNGRNAFLLWKIVNKTFGKVIIYSNGDLVVDNADLSIHFDVRLDIPYNKQQEQAEKAGINKKFTKKQRRVWGEIWKN